MVRKFDDVSCDEPSRLSSVKEISFGIEVELETTPILKALFRLVLAKLMEQKE